MFPMSENQRHSHFKSAKSAQRFVSVHAAVYTASNGTLVGGRQGEVAYNMKA